MSEQDPRRHLAALINEHLGLHGLSRRAFANEHGVNPNTLGDFLNGKRTPTDASLRSMTNAAGWEWSKVAALLDSPHPQEWTADRLMPDPWGDDADAPALQDVDVAALTWEICRRIHTKDAELERLRAENSALRAQLDAATPAPPKDAYALAADADRSGHGRRLAEEMDAIGEESQDMEGRA